MAKRDTRRWQRGNKHFFCILKVTEDQENILKYEGVYILLASTTR